MKRYSMVLVLGLVVMLLAMAPQLRADCTDHFNYGEHNNTIFSDKDDASHGHSWWADKDNDRDRHGWKHDFGDWNFGGGTGDSDDDESSSGSTKDAATPEPSTLELLLSSLLAAGLGLALKKAA